MDFAPLLPQLDPQTDQVLEQKKALPYVTTRPTMAPSVNGKEITLKEGSSYYLVVYVDGDWRYRKFGTDITTPVPLADGGTGKALTASNGAVAYSDADSLELSTVGSTGQYLKSNGAAAPTWSAAYASFADQENAQIATFVDDDNVETTLASLSIPAMATNDALLLHIFLSNSGGNFENDDILKLRANGTSILTVTVSSGSPGGTLNIQGIMANRNSTSAQWFQYVGETPNTLIAVGNGTAAADTSSAFTLDLRSTIPVANTEKTINVQHFSAVLIKAA